jgi:hypothetical protein
MLDLYISLLTQVVCFCNDLKSNISMEMLKICEKILNEVLKNLDTI